MIKCESCGHIFHNENALVGENPFEPRFTVYGCPKCKEIEQFVNPCAVDDCEETGTEVFRNNDGEYFWLCYDHYYVMLKE